MLANIHKAPTDIYFCNKQHANGNHSVPMAYGAHMPQTLYVQHSHNAAQGMPNGAAQPPRSPTAIPSAIASSAFQPRAAQLIAQTVSHKAQMVT